MIGSLLTDAAHGRGTWKGDMDGEIGRGTWKANIKEGT